MLYDIRLKMTYDYDYPVAGGRHALRVLPLTVPGAQRLVAASLGLSPQPDERSDGTDFFGNAVSFIAYRGAHDHLEIAMAARVSVEKAVPATEASPPLALLRGEIDRVFSVGPESPHHFLGASPQVAPVASITDYARACVEKGESVADVAWSLCRRIDADFTYDAEATDVSTPAETAFRLRRGVCQDFAHIMIAGLRGIGIPAGYVSGYLRTDPPPGRERLEGADAMHAWVRAWCGAGVGWLEFDPTNAMMAGNDHIAAGYGRDYGDVAPIIGVLRAYGGQEVDQAVDVTPVE